MAIIAFWSPFEAVPVVRECRECKGSGTYVVGGHVRQIGSMTMHMGCKLFCAHCRGGGQTIRFARRGKSLPPSVASKRWPVIGTRGVSW